MRCQVKDVKNSKRNHCRIKDKDFCAEFDGKKCAVEQNSSGRAKGPGRPWQVWLRNRATRIIGVWGSIRI